MITPIVDVTIVGHLQRKAVKQSAVLVEAGAFDAAFPLVLFVGVIDTGA